MEFIIITGMSGAGKTKVLNALEDIGFYCIDNIPPNLIETFSELFEKSVGEVERAAISVDVRGRELLEDLPKTIERLKGRGGDFQLLFLDANDSVLKQRYKETRRRHPLMQDNSTDIDGAVAAERAMLFEIRQNADYYIDTSFFSTAQLKEKINAMFLKDDREGFTVNCISFGYKYGIPADADLVFDVRCFKNPFYVPELKNLTGLDEKVSDYVFSDPGAKKFLTQLKKMLDLMLPLYYKEGKSYLVIAFGCTGGKHRSVAFAGKVCAYLTEKGTAAHTTHRDIRR